jgi:hypothetical protein
MCAFTTNTSKARTTNPGIGLVLCSEKSETVVRYSRLAEQQQLFATKYLPFLPSEEIKEPEKLSGYLRFEQKT